MHRLGGSLLDLVDLITPNGCVDAVYPICYEDLDFPYGYMLYSTVLSTAGQNLSVPGIRDHGYVMLDEQYKVNRHNEVTRTPS